VVIRFPFLKWCSMAGSDFETCCRDFLIPNCLIFGIALAVVGIIGRVVGSAS
jgi:hypothetical protein